MSGKSMSEEGDKDGVGDSPPPGVLDDAEACKGLDQEELTARVRKLNEDLEATRIPLHDVPVALAVERITREKIAASWSRLCHDGGRPGDGRHIAQVVRSTSSPSSPTVAMATGAFRHHATARSDEEQERQPQQQQQRSPLTWEGEYPRSRYRGDFFKPPIFDDEPSDSDDDESHQAPPGGAAGSN